MVQEGSIFIQIYVSIHSIITLIFSKNRPIWTLNWLVVLKYLFSFVFLIFSTFAVSYFMFKESILFISKFNFILELSQKCTYRNWTLSFPFSLSISIQFYIHLSHFHSKQTLSSSSFKNNIPPNRKWQLTNYFTHFPKHTSSVVAIRLAQLPPV